MKIGAILDIELLRLARGGKAVGRMPDGRVVFVAGGAPNEVARIAITKINSKVIEGRFLESIGESPHRRSAPCPVVQKCGGCPWQHIEYREQVAQKTSLLRETLRRGHALREIDNTDERDFVPSRSEWRYRSRITVHVRADDVGFMRRGTHDFVPISDCLIAHEGLVAFAKNHRPVGAERFQVTDSARGPKLGGAFTQVHLEQNAALQERVTELMLKHLGRHIGKTAVRLLDLYCGNGNFTFPLLGAIQRQYSGISIDATGVELSAESVASARARPPLANLHFEQSDVTEWLKRQQKPMSSEVTELVLLDPPRVGCDVGTIQYLARRKPSLIVYVSCDPSTLARDLARFHEFCAEETADYRVSEFGGFDLFPQTDHIEAIVVIERKGN